MRREPLSSGYTWRWVGKVFAWIIGAVMLAATVVILWLQSPPGRRYVTARVTALLADRQIDLATTGLSYDIFNLSLSVGGLSLRAADRPDLPTFATIERGSVDLSLLSLVRGRYVVQSGRVDGLTVHYVLDESGRDNVPRPPADPHRPTEPLDFLIANLEVIRTRVRYEDRRRGVDVVMPVSLVTVEGSRLTDRHDVTFAAGGGELRVQGRTLAIERVAGDINLGRDDVTFDALQIVADGATAEVTGSVVGFTMPDANLHARMTIDAAQANAFAAVGESVSGEAVVDATLRGMLPTAIVSGRIRSADLRYRTLDDLRLDAQGQYDPASRRIDVSALTIQSPHGNLVASGRVVMAGNQPSRVDLQLSTVSAARVGQAFRLPYSVASLLDGQAHAEWPGLMFRRASGTASLRLTPVLGGRRALPVGGRLDVAAQEGGGQAQLAAIRVAGVQIDGRVTLSRSQSLSGRLQMRAEDVGRTVVAVESMFGSVGPTSANLPTLSGPAAVTIALSGTVDSPGAEADVLLPALRIGAAAVPATVAAELGYGSEGLAIRRANLSWQDARIQAFGRVGLAGGRPIDLHINAESVPVDQLLAAVGQETSTASGRLSFIADLSGEIARPIGTVSLRGEDITAYGEQLGTLEGSAALAGPEVIIDSLTIDKPQPEGAGQLTARGKYQMDQRAYTVDVSSNNLRLLSLRLPGGRHVAGEVELTANVSGTIERPAGTINLAVGNLEVDRRSFGHVDVDVRLADGAAAVHLSANRFNAVADATVGTERPFPATVIARFDGLNLEAMPLQFETVLTGTVRGSLEATTTLTEPLSATASASIDAFSGTWRGQPFSIEGPATFRYAAERLQIDMLTLRAQDSTVTIAGDVPVTERAGEGTVSLDARANLATLAQYAPAGTDVAADGTLTLTGTVSGKVRGGSRAITPDLDLAIDNGLILSREIEPGLSNLTLRAHIGDGEATIDRLTGAWGAARVQLMALVPFDILPELPVALPSGTGPARITASVEGLSPAAIPGAPAAAGGRISLEANAETSSVDLADLNGQIVFPDLELTVSGLTLAQSEPSTIRLANGIAQIERLELGGSLGALQASGTMGLVGGRPLNLRTTGQLQIGVVGLLVEGVQAEGQSNLEVTATGTVTNPDLRGFISIDDGNLVVDEPNVVAAGVWARVDFIGREAFLSQLTAELNGGSLTGWGSVVLGGGGVTDVNIGLNTDDFAFDAPLDLRSLSDSDLSITKVGEDVLIAGQVSIEEAGLTGDINFDTGLIAAINARQTFDLTEERSPLLERVLFNVGVTTATPILVENNLARAEVDVDVRVLGTPYDTGLSGALTVLEEGQVTLNERTYVVERGVIDFIDERDITPSFDLRLTTTASNYDIVVAVSGTLNDTETTLTSTPALPEPDIMAVLVTGRTLDEMRGEEYDVAREQVLSYLTGRLGSTLGRGLQQATGLSTVRIEPNLIANEADPSARLTLGQELTDNLELIYSTDLAESNDQIWMLRYLLARRFQSRGVRQPDNSYRVDIRHDLRFGGIPEPRRIAPQRPDIAEVTVDADTTLSEMELRDLLGVESGQSFDYFAARNGAQKIEERLAERGHLQARVRLRRRIDGEGVHLALRVTEGPLVDIRFTGAAPPSNVQTEVRRQWLRGVFDIQRMDDGREAIRAWLLESGHFEASIEPQVEDPAAGARRVTFRIEPGERYGRTQLVFEGASAVEPSTLDDIVTSQDLERQVFTDPLVVTELLQRYYRDQGYLSAEVDTPRYEYAGGIARVVMEVREGPRFTIRELQTSGNAAVARAELLPVIPMAAGDPFLPFAAENALQGIRSYYWKQGYNDVKPDFNLTILPGGRVDVTFTIDEGPRTIVGDIAVRGRDRTSERLVLGELEVRADEPLDLTALSRSRQNLYKTGAFSLVDFERTGQSNFDPAANGTGGIVSSRIQPVQLTVNVREVQPYQLRYGGSYDTERAAGAIFDASAHNIIGKARVIGLQSRYDRQLREARIFLSQPSLLRAPLQTTVTLYLRSERNPATEVSDAFDIDRRGVSVQQERKLRDLYVMSYGFRYEKVRTNAEKAAGVPSATVSPFTATLSREGRDEVLDASKGSFLSQALVYSPSWLRVEQPFVKYFGQYFHYFPLQRARRERFTNELLRPRFVFATGARVGLARGIGGEVPRSERFFAGGSTSMRGFAQNAVGPVSVDGVALGGNMLFVLNNEVRFPLIRLLDGVGFADVGNVFDRIGDFSFTDFRQAAGVGVRVRTRWFLLRGDYGVALDPRPGERRSRFFFSIGQAF